MRATVTEKRSPGAGHVYRRKRRDGSSLPGWRVRTREADGTRPERTFPTKDAAETFAARQRVERGERRALGIAELRRVTVADALDDHEAWAAGALRPNTVRTRGVVFDELRARLGERAVLSLTADDVLRFVRSTARERGWSAASQHSALIVVGGFLRWCADEGFARAGVVAGLHARLPRAQEHAPPYLAPDELRLVYAAAPAEIRAAVVLMGEAGLRRNEALHLEHGEIAADLSSVTIRAERSKGHRARRVPLTDVARDALRPVLAAAATPIDRSARVFATSSSRLNVLFRAAMDRIGRRDVTPHTLRHAFASGLMRTGVVDIAEVSKLLGHRSLAVTQRYAVHAPKNSADLAIRALEQSRRQAADSPAAGG